MANAKQCDICGVFYAAHKDSKKLRGMGYTDTDLIRLVDMDLQEKTDYYDDDYNCETLETCPTCMRKVKQYIEALKPAKQPDLVWASMDHVK